MTRFALLTEFAPPDHGGIQASVGPMIEVLGSDVTVIAPQTVALSDRRLVRSLFSGSGWPKWWWLVGWLRRAKQHGLERAIFGHYSAAVTAGLIGRILFGIRYVILVHGLDLLTEQRRWPAKILIGFALRRAEFIGVNSSFVENIVRRYGVSAARIVKTHPFVKRNDIPADRHSRSGTRIITIARLVPRKNIAAILQAVVEVKKHQADTRLDIIGDGPERQHLETEATRLGLTDTVTFHGAVDEATKWRLLQSANVFVMAPTIGQGGADVEGLGLVYLEAASCGLPVIASDTGGIRDAVKHQATGLLVDSQNKLALPEAISRLLNNPKLAELYGQAGRQLILQEFTDQVRLGRFMTMVRGVPEDKQPLVSIIIPAYNAAATMGATLNSVKQQTWKKVEVIVVDDGSTDNLNSALQQFRSTIKLISQQNAGAPTARNNGFDISTGEYILFLDADTVLEPTAVEKMMRALMTHPASDFVYSDFYFGWKKFHLFEYSGAKLRQQNFIHTSSLMRRGAFPRFDPALKKFQDWDLWLTMDKQGKTGLWIPEALFRVTQQSRGVGMSTWLPSFMYRLPRIGQSRGNATIAKYRRAEAVIRQKHGF